MSEADQVKAAREAFGRTLRDLRRDAGLSGRELAALTGFADYKISRLERARTSPSEEEIRVWARACGAEGRITELIALYRALDEMWEEHRKALRAGGIAQRSERVKPLYERTRLIRAYEPHTVPGFLQQRAYTRAVVEDVARFYRLDDDLDAATEKRMNRLRVLESGRCRFSFVIEAAALYAQRGDVATMLDQLDYLDRAQSFPNVALGIIPLGQARELWPGECFYVYDEALVRSEHWTGGYRAKNPAEIATYLRIFELLRGHAVYGDAAQEQINTARALLQSRASSWPLPGSLPTVVGMAMNGGERRGDALRAEGTRMGRREDGNETDDKPTDGNQPQGGGHGGGDGTDGNSSDGVKK